MKNMIAIALTAAVMVAGAGAIARGVSANTLKSTGLATKHPTNAAYRDGLYLGKLDAKANLPAHLASGRWSRDLDRASFNAGYGAGYMQGSGNPVAE